MKRIIKRIFSFIGRLPLRIVKKIHSKKRFLLPFYCLLTYVLLVVIFIKTSGDSDYNTVLPNKMVNDVTQINPIQVGEIIQPTSVDEIITAIRSTRGPISVGGGRFSMGGQVGFNNSLHIDMRKFNRVLNLDKVNKQVTVQPGIIWRDLQEYIDPHDLSIKIMQTYANFTVGGSMSVNCHGRYIGHGPIISSIQNLKIVTASGEVIQANRQENTEVFKAVIGGYGGIGVIIEATLQLEDNVKVERQTKLVDVKDYLSFFRENIRNNPDVVFQNGDLYPPDYDKVQNVAWVKTNNPLTDTTRITPKDVDYSFETKLVEIVSWGDWGKWIRKTFIDPYIYSKDKVVWRNREASYDVRELEPKSREESTYVLQEYFIPIDNIISFIPKMKAIYDKYDVNMMNVSLRHAHPDKESYLSWAPEEVIAFVVYYKQGTDKESKAIVKEWTKAMTEAILSENGTWYLPYQPHASMEQFNQGYPNAGKYFEVKNKLDSLHRFNNQLLDKYNPFLQDKIAKRKEGIKGYYRSEEQTVLTVPEWYLVFNPKEYADYLDSGENPSAFPFYASIDEYWKLYDRSLMLVSEAYPHNEEYITMLDVIGVSVTLEYTIKIIYENTIGRLFAWFHNGTNSTEENVIVQAQRAYSDFIYHTAWYEFKFLPWIKEVWKADNQEDSNWLRKVERKVLFTFEFLFKAGYAQLIEWAAQASYEAPVTDIYMLVSTDRAFEPVGDIKLMQEDTLGNKIVSVPRWGPFTTNIIELAKQHDIDIKEIGGNDEILVSILTPTSYSLNLDGVQHLYQSSVVTNDSVSRQVCLMPVSKLLPFIRQVVADGNEVEHVFDY